MAFDFLKKALSEASGQPSSARVFSGWTIFWLILGITFAIVYSVFVYKDLVVSLVTIAAGLVAGVLGIKVWQKSKEGKETKIGE